jgi:hypothetical protein
MAGHFNMCRANSVVGEVEQLLSLQQKRIPRARMHRHRCTHSFEKYEKIKWARRKDCRRTHSVHGLNNDDTLSDISGEPSLATHDPEEGTVISKDVIRMIIEQKSASEARNVLLDGVPALKVLKEEQCLDIFAACISAGNYELVTSIYSSMLGRGISSIWGSSDADSESNGLFEWPRASVSLSTEIVKLLCRSLDTKTALHVLKILKNRGIQSSEDIHFGYVVDCADGSGRPLALMQPHEGSKIVADSFSKYEYEVFSGKVMKADSESLVASLSWLKQIGSKLGKASTAAMHSITIESPSGQQRTFKFGTQLSTAPAKPGDRVSIVCAPEQGKSTRQSVRYGGVLSPSPPGKRPGEPLSITNHTVGTNCLLNRPSDIDGNSGPINSWFLTSVVVLVGADAASSLIDPSFPLLFAAVAGSSTLAVSVGANVVLPNLKKLPSSSLGIQETRQKLLQEHVRLTGNIQRLMEETSSDIRMLARLWQLLNKIGSIDHQTAYVSRVERVVEAKDAVEERLGARISMMNEYAKVLSMIEIEVEMETEIPLAEYQGRQLYTEHFTSCILL